MEPGSSAPIRNRGWPCRTITPHQPDHEPDDKHDGEQRHHEHTDKQTQKDRRAILADDVALHGSVWMATDSPTQTHGIAADMRVLAQLDAAAYRYDVTAHRSVHRNASENRYGVAGCCSSHMDRAKQAHHVANLLVGSHINALKKLHPVTRTRPRQQQGRCGQSQK